MDKLKFDDDIYGTIRKNIRKYRKQRGITSAQLAEKVELSHDFISVDTFYRISVVLDVTLDALIQK